jgi:hypothetical protein
LFRRDEPISLCRRAGDDDFGVMTSAEYDGDPEIVIHEFDPWA